MAPPEKEKPSILGLGHGASSDPNAWRPSKARAKDSGSSLGPTQCEQLPEQSPASRSNISVGTTASAAPWRPSKVNEERLSSLSPARRRRPVALPLGIRLLLTFVFFVLAAYFFLRLWLIPEAGQLHPALVIAAVVLILLFASAVIGAIARRRRRKSGDDKSVLRL
jgi:hypothetical protein